MGVTKVVQNSELKQFALIQFMRMNFNWTAHNTQKFELEWKENTLTEL